MGFARFVGLRFLRPKRRKVALSIITIIAVTGVAVGVATLIVVLAVVTGFQQDMTTKILGTLSHMMVMSHNGELEHWQDVAEKVKRLDGVAAVTPFIFREVMAATSDHATGVILRGIDPASAATVTSIANSVKGDALDQLRVEHKPLRPPSEKAPDNKTYPGILLGHDLMASLRVFPQEELTIVNPIGEAGPMGPAPKSKTFVVVGEFQSGLYEFDAKFGYLDLKVAQDFFNADNTVTGLEVRLTDMWETEAVTERIRAALGWPYYTRDWKDMNRNLFTALKLEKLVMFIILCLIIFVAALNVFSTLYMVVMDKQRSIAMIVAMGASASQIRRIFMFQGLVTGVLGTVLGAALGVGVCLAQMKYKFVALDPRVYFIDTLPISFTLFDFFVIFAASLGLIMVATAIPAGIASRLDPVRTLRYE
jgi:lipoprotein-releasing system permease protein